MRGALAAAVDFVLGKSEPTVGGGGREIFARLVRFFQGFSQFDELRGLLGGVFVCRLALGLEGFQLRLMLFQGAHDLRLVT